MTTQDLFVVCGLGRLGQACVGVLKEFGVRVHTVELVEPRQWDIPDVPDLIDQWIVGDCRQARVLERAGVKECRAVLLVTSNERVNIAAAFAVRSLNPEARLVVRSAEDNLNDLLGQQLGNFVAFEATQLPAPSFALAALGSETRGFFPLENQLMRVVRLRLDEHHRWCDRPHPLRLHELSGASRQLLSHIRSGAATPTGFYQWDPTTRVQVGDNLTYIEIAEPLAKTATRSRGGRSRLEWLTRLRQVLNQTESRSEDGKSGPLLAMQLWQTCTQTQRVGVLSSLVMLSVLLLGMLLYKLQYPEMDWHSAFNVALVLSLGGFDNLFGNLKLDFVIPWWLYGFSVGMTISGTIFIGILYAILTERVLASRLQFVKRRPPIPKGDHVVIVGLGRVGKRVATLLQSFKQPVVGVHESDLDAQVLPQISLVTGNLKEALDKVNLETAKSVIVTTEDEVANLEMGLMARSRNATCNLVIRVFDPHFAANVAQFLPEARVFGAYAVAAEAFAAAAFGENILDLFRLNNRTTLVTEYRVEAEDTLQGKLLADIAYGYGVVPILHQRLPQPAKLFPAEDIVVQAGDRLVVLATIAALQQVEQGTAACPEWRVQITAARSEDAKFEGERVLTRSTHCDIGLATQLMAQLPATLPRSLHYHQAHRLVRLLRKAQVDARVFRDD
jgi:Trk K+ transport system NAD-binding subunit